MKCVLGLAAALSAVACGESTQEVGDTYQGVIDATVLDNKFKPASGTYKPVKAAMAHGAPVAFYNLGLVAPEVKKDGKVTTAGVPVDDAGRPYLPASQVTLTSYDFADGCQTGKADFDFRTDNYPENVQWPLFEKLPLPVTGATTPPVLPLVKVKRWTGTGSQQCNAIKDVKSLTEGAFGGSAAEGETVALRAIIDVSARFDALRDGSTFTYSGGWYRGLQLGFLDGGSAPVDAEGNVKVMDGVLVSPPSSNAAAGDTATYLFAAQPGEEGWSPVVRLRTFTATAAQPASSYTGVCYDDAACGETELHITPLNKYSGVLFVVGSTL